MSELPLPFDILDHIFSFIKFHPKALLTCSKVHPVFSQIVERYRFRHLIIGTGVAEFSYSFKPSDLFEIIAETPWIVKYVAVLQIEFNYFQYEGEDRMARYLDEVASLLPMFPVLECIILRSSALSWQKNLPQTFRTAVENCLHLPTLQEVHVGDISFPLSILDTHANVNYLSLSGPPQFESEYPDSTYPQIKYLALEGFEHNDTDIFITQWAKHIVELQSLKYDFSCHRNLLEVVEICSDTLENLYICLHRQGTPSRSTLFHLSLLPNLRRLTIHAEIYSRYNDSDTTIRTSYLPTAVNIFSTSPSLQELILEIYVDPSWAHLDTIDLSSLQILSEYSVRFPHVDLYMYTGSPHLPITHTIMRSLLEEHDLIKLVEQRVLFVHPEEAAPTLSRAYIAKENDDTCIIM